jgi:rifampicin phosphotransferase
MSKQRSGEQREAIVSRDSPEQGSDTTRMPEPDLDEGGDRWFLDSVVGDRFPAWTRGNAADVFPEPLTPLAHTLYVRPGLSAGLRDAYISIGVLDWHEVEHPETADFFKVFGGYFYNPLSLTRLLGARMPGVTPEVIDKAFFDDRDEVPAYRAESGHESDRHAELLGASMQWAMTVTELPDLDLQKVDAERVRDDRPDLASLSDAMLIARARSLVPMLQAMFETGMIVSSLASLGPGALGAICATLGDPSLTVRLLAGIDVDSAAPSHAMWALADKVRDSTELSAAFDAGVDDLLDRLAASTSPDAAAFLADFHEFVYRYGSRGANEWDVIAPTWEVQPRTAMLAIDLMRRSDPSNAPAARHLTSVAERDRVAAFVREQLAGDAEALAGFEAALHSAQLFLSGRERYKTNCIIIVHEMRMAVRELGRRLVERDAIETVEQVFMLTNAELDAVRQHPERYAPLVADRWRRYRALFDLEPPFVVVDDAPALSSFAPRVQRVFETVAAGTVLTGAAGSGGVASGRACIVLDPSEAHQLEPGDVLVAPQTDPAWVPLFVAAAAVVVNVGALGSHAMIVSRELGIPCVVSVQDATGRIPEGAMLTVDGNAGTVTAGA